MYLLSEPGGSCGWVAVRDVVQVIHIEQGQLLTTDTYWKYVYVDKTI